MKYILWSILWACTFSVVAQEQNNVNGKVLDESGNPLIGANIFWEGSLTGTTSDNNGMFFIAPPSKFPDKLTVSFVGFKTKNVTIQSLGTYEIVLEESVNIDEVDVESTIKGTELSFIDPLQVEKINSKELEKAACCNLSESFETNASVDVTYSDAVTGAKQIKMMGLDGVYTQITQQNLPLVRGLSSPFGLSYVPGTWIESIQIIKGQGSVVNGYEAFTGQINVDYIDPINADKVYWNAYANSESKFENNLHLSKQHGDWKSMLFTHVNYHDKEIDYDNNFFLDMNHMKTINLLNTWSYDGSDKVRAKLSARFLDEQRDGGQIESVTNPYKIDIDNRIVEFNSKTGVLLPNHPGKSFGIQTAFLRHDQNAMIGTNIYDASQESVYLNAIGQTIIVNTDHIVKFGLNYIADRYRKKLNNSILDRVDLVSGAFVEYSLTQPKYTFVLGFRSDYFNDYGVQYIPRVNFKYNPSDQTVVRFSSGKSYRLPNLITENISHLASSRSVNFSQNLGIEKAWNFGVNITHCFYVFDREATFNADAYRTQFESQVVVDIENQHQLKFYNLNGESYSNSFQFDLSYSLIDNLELKMAYKINQVYSTYENVKKLVPLVPKERALFNLGYSTDHKNKWLFDVTLNYIGESRIPEHNKLNNTFSNPFSVMNAQITKKYDNFDIYLGTENFLDYTQDNPILDSQNPFGNNFDASIIWAPIMGRFVYTGIRLKIN